MVMARVCRFGVRMAWYQLVVGRGQIAVGPWSRRVGCGVVHCCRFGWSGLACVVAAVVPWHKGLHGAGMCSQ